MISQDKLFPASKTTMWPLEKIKPFDRNPRKHPQAQIDLLAKLIKTHGADQPIVVDESGIILKGHGRLLAAQLAGLTEFPVVVQKGLSNTEKQGVRIADNQVALLSGWDEDFLREGVVELRTAGFDISLLGFDSQMLDGIFDFEIPEAAEIAPEKPKKPIVRTGDCWALGEHRLLCGDATNANDVAKLLAGMHPNLMVTDPPYGVEYDADWRNHAKRLNGKKIGGRAIGPVNNDNRSDWREAWAHFPGDVAYCWHGGLLAHNTFSAFLACGFEARAQIIWAKQQFVISRGHYHVQHEPCFYLVREGTKGHWQGDRTQSTLWQIDKPFKSETGHSAQKPIECMKRPMENNSARGDYIYDPFVGSGTTIIAAEITDRKCLAMDIDPGYVQVCIERWQTFTKKVATLDGKEFSEVAKERTRAPRRSRKQKKPAARSRAAVG